MSGVNWEGTARALFRLGYKDSAYAMVRYAWQVDGIRLDIERIRMEAGHERKDFRIH